MTTVTTAMMEMSQATTGRFDTAMMSSFFEQPNMIDGQRSGILFRKHAGLRRAHSKHQCAGWSSLHYRGTQWQQS